MKISIKFVTDDDTVKTFKSLWRIANAMNPFWDSLICRLSILGFISLSFFSILNFNIVQLILNSKTPIPNFVPILLFTKNINYRYFIMPSCSRIQRRIKFDVRTFTSLNFIYLSISYDYVRLCQSCNHPQFPYS